MPRVLITGVAGFIGMHTAIRFLKEGWDVVGVDNMNEYYDISLKRNRIENIQKVSFNSDQAFDVFYEDLNSAVWEKLNTIDFQSVVHLAAQGGVRYSLENPLAYLESNIFGFQKVLEFVKIKHIDRFIYASSSSVYGKDSKQPFTEDEPCNSPESYYAATKKANEAMAHAYNKTHHVSSVGLRFFTVYGPWGRPDMAPMIFTKSAFNNESIDVFNYGNQKRDFTYIDDIIEGIYRIVTKKEFPNDSIVLNIGRGTPIKLGAFIEEIERNTQKKLRKNLKPPQKGDVTETYADLKRLKEFIDYSPVINLSAGINEFVNWYKSYYGHI